MIAQKIPIAICLLAVLLATACKRTSEGSQTTLAANSTRTFTKSELDRLIVLGTYQAELTNTLGIPDSELPAGENATILMYTYPLESADRGSGLHLTGFTVKLTNGAVAGWSPIMTEFENPKAGGSQRSMGEHSFKMFSPPQNLQQILGKLESEGSADATSLKTPDIAFNAKTFVGPGNEGSGAMTLILVLNDQDASKLGAVTKGSVGERKLLVWRDKVIAAPLISEPITSKKIMINLKDSRVLNSLQNASK
jgi:hypothetical protein